MRATRGSYPLFKPGASSLGGGCVQVGLSLQPGRLADCKGLTHEMEISVRSGRGRGGAVVNGWGRGRVVSAEVSFLHTTLRTLQTRPQLCSLPPPPTAIRRKRKRSWQRLHRPSCRDSWRLQTCLMPLSTFTRQCQQRTQLRGGWEVGVALTVQPYCLLSHSLSSCASAYAVVHPHPLVERITTPCAPFVPRPSWNHHSKTKIPRELLDSHVRAPL